MLMWMNVRAVLVARSLFAPICKVVIDVNAKLDSSVNPPPLLVKVNQLDYNNSIHFLFNDRHIKVNY